ncbi:MAG: hypothetical protein HOD92_12310 [Deltaproteobacteria bacterium]|jgi:hypothetical protein|nr:hypothetical protein [Deltaproteobacteria bacterium]MBT4526311.1 hypothetical protein [Deltaproteobacteria bacterium]
MQFNRIWRLDYSDEEAVSNMIAQKTFKVPDDLALSQDITKKMSAITKNHGLLLAKFNSQQLIGEVKALGHVIDKDRKTKIITVEWRRHNDIITPTHGEGYKNWTNRPCFEFPDYKIEQYNLLQMFSKAFKQK